MNSPDVHQHVSDESPGFLPFVGVVYEEVGDGPPRVHAALRGVVHEQDDLHQADDDHADGRRPAAVLLLVGAV